MSLPGKSIFVWQNSQVCGGDPLKTAATLKAAGFESAILHDVSIYSWRTPTRISLIKALKDVGIAPIGGAAVYGKDPQADGIAAAAICNDYDLPAFNFDAESAFDAVPAPDSAAANMLRAFKSSAPQAKIGWCWWAFHRSTSGTIKYHPKAILWAAMAKGYGDADFGIPMTYWSWGDGAGQAIAYLQESYKQWREVVPGKPIVPAGRAYIGDGGTPRAEAIIAFEAEARSLGCPGVTWWSMQHAMDGIHLPGIWAALSALKPFGEVTPPPVPADDWQHSLDKWARTMGYTGPEPV